MVIVKVQWNEPHNKSLAWSARHKSVTFILSSIFSLLFKIFLLFFLPIILFSRCRNIIQTKQLNFPLHGLVIVPHTKLTELPILKIYIHFFPRRTVPTTLANSYSVSLIMIKLFLFLNLLRCCNRPALKRIKGLSNPLRSREWNNLKQV